ncbi:helix-turn-helix domain-containing protein [Streptomyces sp. ME01-18a]|uniref:helix-turn-helix domain-containing protein n=1 Tax=Streptomyces sp. ME01-18a TaxID=3028669 RepID=UPI0029BA0668|nr:helix-turn-helix domain-containing protein [Streptomyces sp. ME01-18a]MDX3434163.1 helix-turn-helix domain-containing protein [Streptomyces sp. ME01-18a]
MTRSALEVERLRPWLEAVAEISKLVNAISHDGLLVLIARRTAELTEQDFCAVQMRDVAAQRLLIVGSHGLSDQYVATINSDRPVGLVLGSNFYDSPSSRAYRSRSTVLISDIQGAESFTPWRRLAEEQGYRSILAVPMLVMGEVVGVIACYSRRPGAPDASEMVAGVELMAEQAALANHMAELRRREALAKAEVEESNRLLIEHQKALERAEHAHRQLTHLVLAGHDLQAITQELSFSPCASVAIEDITYRSVVHSSFEGRQIHLPGQDERETARFSVGRRDGNRIMAYRPYDATGPHQLHVCPVIAGGELIGRLRVQPSAPHLDAADRRSVEGAALVIAMEMLKRRAALEVELRLSRDVLSDLLLGDGRHDPRDLIDLARQIGHDPGTPHQVLVGGFIGTGQRKPKAADHHMVTAALQATDGIRPKPLIGLRQGIGVLLLPLLSNSARTPQQIAGHWHDALVRHGDAAVITGDVVAETTGYPHAFAVASGALRLMTRGGEPSGVRELSEFGLFTLLLRSSDPQPMQNFARSCLAKVHAYDQKRGTDLLTTLRAYLRHDGRTGEVARELTVHPNTLLNRVSRLEDLLGTDLNDPRGRLEIQLTLMIDAIGQVNALHYARPRRMGTHHADVSQPRCTRTGVSTA